MAQQSVGERLVIGAMAGLVGTLVLQSLRTHKQKLAPGAEAPIRQDPGKFMVKQTEKALPSSARRKIPEEAETAAGKALGLGYGMTFGLLYAALRSPKPPTVQNGLLLGLACWAAGYLGWLPATGLMRPVWQHRPNQIVAPLVEHALYGLATAAGVRWFQRRAP
jgi:hypothetical protein